MIDKLKSQVRYTSFIYRKSMREIKVFMNRRGYSCKVLGHELQVTECGIKCKRCGQ
jgi:hypothetical protein